MRGVLALLCLLLCLPASAQLARSYYNVTGIKTRKLANAVQILIQTDGNIAFDMETAGLFTLGSNFQISIKPQAELRLRLNGARIKVPTFNELGVYPADSVVVGLGNEPLKQPYSLFRGSSTPSDPSEPRVDLLVRFYIPVLVGFDSIKLGNEGGGGISQPLGPREARIELTPDRRSIQITVVLDRVEADRGEENLKRSPVSEQHHALQVSQTARGLQLHALHTPLADLLDQVHRETGLPLLVQRDAAAVDISLNLPQVTVAELLKTLSLCYGLAVQPYGDGFLIGRGEGTLVTEPVVLKHLTPGTARALLPDFLLPRIRTDDANNALVVTAPPEVVARVRADLIKLDTPRPQVKLTTVAYELTGSESLNLALSAALGDGAFSAESAQLSVTLQPGRQRALAAQLTALEQTGRLKLVAQPSVTVASGAKGTLFAGQDRFIQVLVNSFAGLTSQALRLPIGTELTVTPLVGTGGEITLQLQPKFTVVEDVEAGTGLPTLGISTFESTLRLKPGETVLVGNLETDSKGNRRHTGSRTTSTQKTALLLLLTATLEKTP